jgi:nitrogenase-stabilizing/protective protein
MKTLSAQLPALSSAEDFLAHFDVPFDERVVQVNRLHILQRFHQYLQREPALDALEGARLHDRCRQLLQRAYQDFVESTPARERVFKVFRAAQGPSFPLEGLRRTLPSHAAPAAD